MDTLPRGHLCNECTGKRESTEESGTLMAAVMATAGDRRGPVWWLKGEAGSSVAWSRRQQSAVTPPDTRITTPLMGSG